MSKRTLVWLLANVLLITVSPAEAQQAGKVPRIGFIASGSLTSYAARTEAFRQGLRDLDYIEGKNIVIEYRYEKTSFDQVAVELIQLKVDVIVTGGTPAALAAKRATATIPIVVALSADTVGAGLVDSLARPGGNVTGLTSLSGELSGKRLELIKEVRPKVASVAVLTNPANKSHAPALKESEAAAQALGIQMQIVNVGAANELDRVFSSEIGKTAGGLILLADGIFTSQRRRIVELVVKRHLIGVYYDKEFVEAGGLISYGVNIPALFYRAAAYVDKILKGRAPGDLPVEQPMKFELVINLKTAKQIGLTIPQWTLMKADRVIR